MALKSQGTPTKAGRLKTLGGWVCVQAGCEMLRALPDHDAPRDLTFVAEHAESIFTRVLGAQSAAVSLLDMHSRAMTSVTVPTWLGARDQHPIKLSNAAYCVISQESWHAVRSFLPRGPLKLTKPISFAAATTAQQVHANLQAAI